MLVLTRKVGESIIVDDHIKVTIVQIKGKQVRVGVEAPPQTRVHREEVYRTIQDENRAAMGSIKTHMPNFKIVTNDKTGTNE